jgi:DNA (cytosine-5)-methyltransferase 1
VVIGADRRGRTYVLADIGMRMLVPRELARAQGFPDSYILTGSQRDQIARIGNSVCPPVAKALVAAQLGGIVPSAAA